MAKEIIKTNCDHCNKEFIYKHRKAQFLKQKKHYCSKDCLYACPPLKKDTSKTGPESFDCTCCICGKSFVFTWGKTAYDRTKEKYCGKACKTHVYTKAKNSTDNFSKEVYSMYVGAKKRAEKSGIPFNLEYSDMPEIPKLCPILGIEIRKITKDDSYKYNYKHCASLDKIIPSLGYIKGNVRIISHRANTLKNNANSDEIYLIYKDLKNLGL